MIPTTPFFYPRNDATNLQQPGQISSDGVWFLHRRPRCAWCVGRKRGHSKGCLARHARDLGIGLLTIGSVKK